MPFVIFGSLNIMAGVAMPALPETLGVPAAATVQVSTNLHSKTHHEAGRQIVHFISVTKCLIARGWQLCGAA